MTELEQARADLRRLMQVARVVRHKKTRSALEFATALAEMDQVVHEIEVRELFQSQRVAR